MKIAIGIILNLFIINLAIGQSNLEAHYSFDNCEVRDITQVHLDGVTSGGVTCTCGPSQDAMNFDGNDDFVDFETDLNDIFQDDFSISFYFRIGAGTEPMDIISYRPSCAKDSSFSIRYLPANAELSIELAEDFGNRARLSAIVEDNGCWHWLVFTRSVTKHVLFLDGVKVDEDNSNRMFSLHDTTNLRIANSPCVGSTDIRFNGQLDELKLFKRAIDETEIPLLDLRMDEILTNDTVIFLGDNLLIETGPTCSNSFSWSPTTDLDDPFDLNPTASPSVTTNYAITFNYNGCVVFDDINVSVVDPSQLDCENLLLPNAFSPNNDGLNDQFGISNDFIVESLISFEVFDKWGAQMFITSSKGVKWDGNFKGQTVNPGVFAYKVKYLCAGSEYVKVGSVNVIR